MSKKLTNIVIVILILVVSILATVIVLKAVRKENTVKGEVTEKEDVISEQVVDNTVLQKDTPDTPESDDTNQPSESLDTEEKNDVDVESDLGTAEVDIQNQPSNPQPCDLYTGDLNGNLNSVTVDSLVDYWDYSYDFVDISEDNIWNTVFGDYYIDFKGTEMYVAQAGKAFCAYLGYSEDMLQSIETPYLYRVEYKYTDTDAEFAAYDTLTDTTYFVVAAHDKIYLKKMDFIITERW